MALHARKVLKSRTLDIATFLTTKALQHVVLMRFISVDLKEEETSVLKMNLMVHQCMEMKRKQSGFQDK